MAFKLRAIAEKLVLVAVSTMIGFFLVGFVFFRLVLPNIRFVNSSVLTETASVLVQDTKTGAVPKHYVAILGDSYAEGFGDGQLKVEYTHERLVHAAHAVRELTGRDVVTFGKAGAGSAEAYVLMPTRMINGSYCLTFPTIEDPTNILAYFYEGNDIYDNRRFLQKVQQKYGRVDASAIDEYLATEYAVYQWWRCHAHLGDVSSRIARFLYISYRGLHDAPPTYGPPTNTLLIAERNVGVGPLQGPALDLGPEQLASGILVFERSLAWLRNRFPHSVITVVYVPAPSTVYSFAGSEVKTLFATDKSLDAIGAFPVANIVPYGQRTCASVRDASVRARVGFLNPRPTLRRVAAAQPIHGPLDWNHFNETGYRLLGEVLAQRLPDPTRVDDCD